MTVPTDIRQRLTEPSQGSPVLELIEISHADLDNTLYFVNNNPNESIISNGQHYLAFPVDLLLPNRGENLPRARVSLPNVSRRIGEILRQITTPLQVTLKLIYADDPDNVFETYDGLQLRNVDWNAVTIEGELQDDDMSQEPIPWLRCTQDKFQALHRL